MQFSNAEAFRGAPMAGTYPFTPNVLWESREGQVSYIGTLTLCFLTSILVVPLVYGVCRMILTASHKYELTEQRLKERTGIFSLKTEELELFRVKDITVNQPLMQRLFGRGNVVLSTTDKSNPLVELKAVEDPSGVAELIRFHVDRCRMAKGLRELEL